MNVLEALKALKDGYIVKLKLSDGHGKTLYYLQTFLHPLGDKAIVETALCNIRGDEDCPDALGSMDWEDLERMDLDAVESEDFVIISADDMIKEWRFYWSQEQDNL